MQMLAIVQQINIDADCLRLFSIGVASLFFRQLPDAVTHNEGSVFAVVPHHEVPVHHLPMPYLRAERRTGPRVNHRGLTAVAVLVIDFHAHRSAPKRK
jgi:hypothetical protein